MVRRGITLIEAVLAIFLMLVGILLIGNLFLAGLRYIARSERRVLATLLAERTLAGVRASATTPLGFDGLLARNGETSTDGEFTTTLQVRAHVLKSPSYSLEADQVVAQQRLLNTSSLEVQVRVARGPETILSLWTLVSDAPRTLDHLQINPVGAVPPLVAQDGMVNFTVDALDTSGNLVRDCFFNWYVLPRTGNGMIYEQDRDGRRATFQHRVVLRPPGFPATILHVGGRVSLSVRAVYRGQEVTAAVPLELAP